jgi:hypothetical protein
MSRSATNTPPLTLFGYEGNGRMDHRSIPQILLALSLETNAKTKLAEMEKKMSDDTIDLETHKIGYSEKQYHNFCKEFESVVKAEADFFNVKLPAIEKINYDLLLKTYNRDDVMFQNVNLQTRKVLNSFKMKEEDLRSLWNSIRDENPKPKTGKEVKENFVKKINLEYEKLTKTIFDSLKYNLKYNILSEKEYKEYCSETDFIKKGFFAKLSTKVDEKKKKLSSENSGKLRKDFSSGHLDRLIKDLNFKGGVATLKVNYDSSPNHDGAGHDFLLIIDRKNKKLTMVDAYTGKQDAQVTQMFAQSRPDISLWCKQNHYEFVFEKGLSLDGSKCQWQKNLAEFFFLKSKEKGVAFEPKRLSDRTNEFNKFVLDIETEMLKTHNIYSSKDTLEISMENLLKHQGVSNAAINSIKKGEVKLDEAGINKILQHHKQPTKWMQEIRNILKNRNLPLNWDNFETVFKEHLDKMTEAQKLAMKDGHLGEKVIVDFLDKNPQFQARFKAIVKGVFTPNINSSQTTKNSPQKIQAQPKLHIGDMVDKKSLEENARLLEENARLLDKFLTLRNEVGEKKDISSALEKLLTKPLAEQNEILSKELKVLNENQKVLRKVPTLRNEVGEKKGISSELKKLSAKPLAEQNKSLSNEKKVLNENQRLLDKFLTLRHEVGEKKDISSELKKLSAKPLAEQNKILSNAVKRLSELKLNNLTERVLDITSSNTGKRGDKDIELLLNKLSQLETTADKIKYLESAFKPNENSKKR